MRITIFLSALVLSLLLISCNTTYAANATSSAAMSTKDLLESFQASPSAHLGESLISPASPLYFLKALREKIEVLIDGSQETRAMRQVEFAQRRLREVSSLIKHNRQDLIPRTLEQYKSHIANIENITNGNEELQVKASAALSVHLDSLEQLYGTTGDSKALMAIRSTIQAVEEHSRELLAKLSLVKQQELIGKIAKAQAIACNFIIRESKSSALNDTERAFLSETAVTCQDEVGNLLKDQLMELKQKK